MTQVSLDGAEEGAWLVPLCYLVNEGRWFLNPMMENGMGQAFLQRKGNGLIKIDCPPPF